MFYVSKILILLYFAIFLPTKQKSNMHSKMKILFKNLSAEQILVSIVFHTVNPTVGIVISKNLTFSDSDFFQAFKCELKRFLLSEKLNNFKKAQVATFSQLKQITHKNDSSLLGI